MSKLHGSFLWYDLNTTDVDGAVDFYTEVIGWQTTGWESEGSDEVYEMWTVDDHPLGGVMELSEEAVEMDAPPHWIAYIGTEDLESSMEEVGELGGRVLSEIMRVPEVGRMAVVSDPQGGIFSLFAPEGSEDDESPTGRSGTITWREIMCDSPRDVWEFYRELFGWEQTDTMNMGNDGVYLMYGRDGETWGGIGPKPKEMGEAPAFWVFYISVDDLDEAVERARNHGGTVMNEPMEVPGGDRVAHCLDPQGAMFALHEFGSDSSTPQMG